jgi:predicted transcriptional regulator
VRVRAKKSENERLCPIERRQIVGAHLAGPSLLKTATLIHVSRAAVSKIMSAYKNRGKTISAKRNNGRKSTLTEIDRRTLRRSYCSTGNRAAELNIHLEDLVSAKTARRELHKSNIHGRAAIPKPLITESDTQMRKRKCPVMTTKSGHETTGNAHVMWSNESPFTLFSTSGRVYVWKTQKGLSFGMSGSNSETRKIFCDGLGNNIVVRYSVVLFIILWPNNCKGVHGQVG